MPLKNYRSYIMDALIALGYPNEFEIFEYLKDSQSAEILRNNSINRVRVVLGKLLKDKDIVKCITSSTRYPYRFSLHKYGPYCKIEPSILRINKKKLITQAIEVNESNKAKYLTEKIQLIPDQNRGIVIALKDNLLLGVVDLRYYHRPKNDVRFPTRFYKQRINQKMKHGMTELHYFSILACKDSKFSKKKWLSVTCWGAV